MAEAQVNTGRYDLVVIGGSAGSLDVLLEMLPVLDVHPRLAIVVVLHRRASEESLLPNLFGTRTSIKAKEVDEKEPILPDTIYIAPADYHLLIEKDKTFSLDYSEKVNYSRPSIDVTFDSAAEVYKNRLACILLSGANADGTAGLQHVHEMGGTTLVQDPHTAMVPYMPQHAISNASIHHILSPGALVAFINNANK